MHFAVPFQHRSPTNLSLYKIAHCNLCDLNFVCLSPVSRNRSLVRAVNRVAVASRNPANSSKSPDDKAASKADNRISVKYYSSVRSLSPGSAGGFFYWIAMRDERRSSCKRFIN